MMRALAIAAWLAYGAAAQTPQFTISTVAGNTAVGITPVPGVEAAIGLPQGIAVDPAGNVYFAANLPLEGLLFKLDSSGLLTRIAGGAGNSGGDGGPASAVMLGNPHGPAMDGAGNLYLAEGNRIRKISPAGIITTVAGNGNQGTSGDGGPATAAALDIPSAIACDSAGNVYDVEAGARIRKIAVDGTIATIAGNGTPGNSPDGGPAVSAQIGQVNGLAVDNSGNVYFSDYYCDDLADDCEDGGPVLARVRKISSGGILSTVAGGGSADADDGGPATAVALFNPGALAVDSSGNVYIADGGIVRVVSSSGAIATAAAVPANGMAPAADGSLYLADANQRIRKLSAGKLTILAGLGSGVYGSPAAPGDGGPAIEAPLAAPTGVAVASDGSLYISDTFNNRIRQISPDGNITSIAGAGTGSVEEGGAAADAFISWPCGAVLDSSGSLYFAETGGNRVRKISAGIITTVAGSGYGQVGYSGDDGPAIGALLSWPKDVAFDSAGNLYIADTGNNRIRKVTPDGTITTIAGTGVYGHGGDGGPASSAQFAFPSGIAVDAAGNLYVADTNNYRVRRIAADGTVTTIGGNGTPGFSGDGGAATGAQLSYPAGIKLDGAGNVYVGDFGAVRRISPAGIITTVAGTGVPGYTGDGGAATSAQLRVWGLAFDAAGRLYVTDPAYNTVRLLTPVQ